ncbi:MAG: class IV adenylate cyclase [Pirellulales bacterium]|nr:class IV adenylate cyclase [Pirellulales bacterium]
MYEVEQKYPVSNPTNVQRQLELLGAVRSPTIVQIDTYYDHPAHRFAKTDEALRIRRIGERNYVTYKGPKIDQTTKTRREIELPLADGEPGAAQFAELLVALGFTPVADVRKRRTRWTLDWQGHAISIAADHVNDLGSFIELEIEADEDQLAAAKERLASLAKELHLTRSERRSYLELLRAQ